MPVAFALIFAVVYSGRGECSRPSESFPTELWEKIIGEGKPLACAEVTSTTYLFSPYFRTMYKTIVFFGKKRKSESYKMKEKMQIAWCLSTSRIKNNPIFRLFWANHRNTFEYTMPMSMYFTVSTLNQNIFTDIQVSFRIQSATWFFQHIHVLVRNIFLKVHDRKIKFLRIVQS